MTSSEFQGSSDHSLRLWPLLPVGPLTLVVDRRIYTRIFQFPLRINVKISEHAPNFNVFKPRLVCGRIFNLPLRQQRKKIQIFQQFNRYGEFGDWAEIPKKSQILCFEKILQKLFQFFCLIKWKKEIRNIYANITSENINAKSAEGVRYALITNENLTAENAEGVRYALITDKNKPVKIAEGLKYVGITDKKINAKIVEGLKYAPITGKKLTAKSAKGPKYARITDKNLNAKSA